MASPMPGLGGHRSWAFCAALFLLASFFVCGFTASPAAAQVNTSSVLGYVFDPSGAPIAGATVTISDPKHSFTRTAETNSDGAYVIFGLMPATYQVKAEAANFQGGEAQAALTVETDQRVDFHLKIAGQKGTVEVTAQVLQVQTESGQVGTVLTQKEIDSLPLNRRDFLQLALLAPGVFPPVQGSELSSRGGFAMHANGGREEFNNFLLDGADNNDPYVNRYAVEPPVDSIQEFKVASSSYSAEYGRSAAGQVNVITRQGTNDFHGSLYEYLRNSVLDARNFFDGPDKPSLIRNQFGFAVGGPVLKGNTYFFAATDFLRGKTGLSRYSSVPTVAERGGDLSALCQTGFTNGLCNPAPPNSSLSATQIFDPLTQQPFLNNQIPAGDISPLVQNILNVFPMPNTNSPSGNYLGQPSQIDNDSQGSYRVDHRFTAKDDVMFRYSFGVVNSFEPYPEGSTNVNGYGDYVRDHIQNFTGQYQRILSTRVINHVILGFDRYSRDLLTQNYKTNVGSLWNVNWLNVPSNQYGYPGIGTSGQFSGAGDLTSLPIYRHTNTYQLGDQVSWDFGKHTLHFGGEVRELQLNGALYLFTRGSLNFTGAFTGAPIGDLLLGFPTYTIQSQANNPLTLRTQEYNTYVQDDWRLLPNLTLNLGVRYEYNVPAYDPTNRMSTLDLKTGQIVTLGRNGYSRSGISSDFNNIAPRLGIAWSPAPTLAVRAGYGIFYDSGMFNPNSAQYFNPPEFNVFVYLPIQGLITVNNPFPSGSGSDAQPGLSILDPSLRTPYMQQWNLSVEKSYKSIGTFSLAYVGSKGTKLIREFDLNQPLPGPGDLQTRRAEQNPLFANYGNIFFIESGANSSFNSLQATFKRPVSSHVSLWVAYTYSHSLDDSSAFLFDTADPNFAQNQHNLGAEWGNSSFDIRNRLTTAAVIQLPNGNPWTRNTEFRQILTVQGGQPFTPLLTFDNSNTGNTGAATNAGSDRPNVVGNFNSGSCPNPSGGAPFPVGTPQCWFNTSAFAIPQPYTFGNAGRNIVRGPGFASFDLSLVRSFNITEGKRLSLEAEAFNLFNRANFDLPGSAVSFQPGSTFGQILSAKASRQLQMSMRFTF